MVIVVLAGVGLVFAIQIISGSRLNHFIIKNLFKIQGENILPANGSNQESLEYELSHREAARFNYFMWLCGKDKKKKRQ